MDDFSEILAVFILILSIMWMHLRVIIKKEFRVSLSRIFLLDGIALLIVLTGFFPPRHILP